MTPYQIARVCHAANRAICQSFDDDSQKPWDEAEQWQRDSAVEGVNFRLLNPDASESAQHDAWMAAKVADGWKFGPTKNPDLKLHPCIVPFDLLPGFQKAKDAVFCAIVDALK